MLFLKNNKKYKFFSSVIFISLLTSSHSIAMQNYDLEKERRRTVGAYHNKQQENFNDTFSFAPKLSPKAVLVLLILGIHFDLAKAQGGPATCSSEGDCYSPSDLSCRDQALQMGAAVKSTFTPYERAFVHPGLYVGINEIKRNDDVKVLFEKESLTVHKEGMALENEFNKQREELKAGWKQIEEDILSKDETVRNNAEEKLNDFKELHKKIEEFFDKTKIESLVHDRVKTVLKVYKIDKDYVNDDPVDSANYRDTLDWIENKILTQGNITKIKTNKLISLLKETNQRLNNVRKIDFRNGQILIKSTPNSVPDFNKQEKFRKYLETYDQKNIKYYDNLALYIKENFSDNEYATWASVIVTTFRDKDLVDKRMIEFLKNYYTVNTLSQKQIRYRTEDALNKAKFTFNINPLRAAATLHQDLVDIHSFDDSNGRTARLWKNILLKQAGYPSIPPHRDNEYTAAVTTALKSQNVEIFEEYMKDQICKITDLYNNPSFDQGSRLEELADTCQEDCQEKFDKLIEDYKL